MNEKLRKRILDWFQENPDETLTIDDMEVKFSGNGTSTLCIEDELEALVKEKKLFVQKGEYSTIKPIKLISSKRPKVAPPKRDLASPNEVFPHKRKRKRGWHPDELRHLMPRKHVYTAPFWMRENMRAPFNRYGEDEKDAHVVRNFWERVQDGENCELQAYVGTGEKRIVFPDGNLQDGWIPLVGHVNGTVYFATHCYTFLKRK